PPVSPRHPCRSPPATAPLAPLLSLLAPEYPSVRPRPAGSRRVPFHGRPRHCRWRVVWSVVMETSTEDAQQCDGSAVVPRDEPDVPAGVPAIPPASLSPSRASDFMRCPLLYRFRVIDRLPEKPTEAATRGTLVHAVLERLFDAPAA